MDSTGGELGTDGYFKAGAAGIVYNFTMYTTGSFIKSSQWDVYKRYARATPWKSYVDLSLRLQKLSNKYLFSTLHAR